MPATAIISATAALPVRNVQQSITFYKTLGFEPERVYDDQYAMIFRDKVELHLRLAPDLIENHNPSGIYLTVHNADDFYTELATAKVKTITRPEDKPWRMREFALSDPDGNLIRVGSRLA